MATRGFNWGTLTDPLIRQNPVMLQILGLCSSLAVTTTLDTSITMAASLTIVLILSSLFVSLIRRHIPDSIRLIVQIIIVASLVIVIDQFLQAYFFDISKRLSVYVALITTNCIVLGRTESFARSNPPIRSMFDALGNGLGYSMVLVIVGSVRELFGKGSLLGFPVLPTIDQGGWYTPLSLMMLAPSAFFLLGGLVWIVRSLNTYQIEAPEHQPLAKKESRA